MVTGCARVIVPPGPTVSVAVRLVVCVVRPVSLSPTGVRWWCRDRMSSLECGDSSLDCRERGEDVFHLRLEVVVDRDNITDGISIFDSCLGKRGQSSCRLFH